MVTQRLALLLDGAEREAKRLKDEYVSVEHLVLALIDEDPSISILVLAASAGDTGPGPLISALTGKVAGRLRVPVTIVPGKLSDAEIAALA